MASSKPAPKRTTSGEISAVKEPALKEFLEKLEEEEKVASSIPPTLMPEDAAALERIVVADAEKRRREAQDQIDTPILPRSTKPAPPPEWDEPSPDTQPEEKKS
jgi:hypothetical protein